MKTETSTSSSVVDTCCSSGCSSTVASASAAASSPGQRTLFRIPTMDCSAEESEIRRALEPLEGIRSLGFQLGARTLKIDADDRALPLALDAIRKAGFDPQPVATAASTQGGQGRVFRIATMDCSAEEAEIRRALEPLGGIRSLGFQLGARTLKIDAEESTYPLALDAIRKAGFDPQPVAGSDGGQAGASADDHDQGHGFAGGISRLVAALVFATGAEVLSFFAPDQMAWKVAGMAIAAVAIWLAGIDTYKKGIAALLRGKLNINALMSVAVTGAFLIGQWPEAAMVMALYAIAELIEAKAVDRARSAITGLLAR